MTNLARAIEHELVTQSIATVVRMDGATIELRTVTGERRARRAVSCLVAPEPGDRVLVASAGAGGTYVLAVLERDGKSRTRVETEGDLEVCVRDGRFSVAAQQGVELVTPSEVAITAESARIHAHEGTVVLDKLAFLGAAVRAEIERVKIVAHAFDTVCDRISQRVKRSFRTVEEIDQVRADQIDYAAHSTMSLHARNAVVTAETLVKVDGEQIHLG